MNPYIDHLLFPQTLLKYIRHFLEAEYTIVNKTQDPCLHEAYILVKNTNKQ